MHVIRIMADLRVPDIEAAKGFYTDYLGLRDEEFNLGWVARYTSPDTGANVQLVTRDATAESVAAGPDPKAHLEAFQPYLDAGFDEIYVANMGPEYADMIRDYGREVLPELRRR